MAEQTITRDMTVGELVLKYPSAVEVLLKHGFQCIGCHVSPHEPLEKSAEVQGISREEFEKVMSELQEAAKRDNGLSAGGKLVEITERAIEKLKSISENEGKSGYGLRIHIVQGGCAGFSYEMDFEKGPAKSDQVMDVHGMKVFFARDYAKYLNGIVVDYRETLKDSGFVMKNPNAKSSCGCGHSFGV